MIQSFLTDRIRNLAAKVLREDPALEQREMITGGAGGGGGTAGSSKGLFLTSKNPMDLQRSALASGSGGRPSLDGSLLRNLDELAGDDEVLHDRYIYGSC